MSIKPNLSLDELYPRLRRGEDVEDLLLRNGDWITCSLDTNIGWPTEPILVSYSGRNLFLVPADFVPKTADSNLAHPSPPYIAMEKSDIELQEAQKIVLRFLSALSWVERGDATVTGWLGGNLPRPMGRMQGKVVAPQFDLRYLPVASSEDARLALALYREGKGLDHPAYAFLSFFKIVERVSQKQSTKWINRRIGGIDDHEATKRVKELKASGTKKIGQYLYKSCRCAAAHANPKEITIDPDNVTDHRRLQNDLPLIRNLAELAIEEVLNIRRNLTVYRQREYHLAGFRSVISDETLEALIAGESIPRRRVDLPKTVAVRVRGQDHFGSLENMTLRVLTARNKRLALRFDTPRSGVKIIAKLNFEEGTLEFDPLNNIYLTDDGSARTLKEVRDGIELQWEIFCNGELEIWMPDDDLCLSRIEAYIPVNMYVDDKVHEKNRGEIEVEIAAREARELKQDKKTKDE